jgi:DNA polymerase-3 subunit delta
MITVLVGENSFEIKEELARLTASFAGDVERYDGEALDRATIADLFGGQTLFADERFIVIRDLSKNTAIWPQVEKLAESIADSTRIVLIEERLDKRTAAYKALKTGGAVKEFAVWGDRDIVGAQQWVVALAKLQGLQLGSAEARLIVERVGLDQWQLASAVEKLSLLDAVSTEVIIEHVELNPKENVFQLFELALSGKKSELRAVLRTLMLTEDPYMVFALLSSQAVQLGVMSVAKDEPAAKDFGIHPFVATKLAAAARRQGSSSVKRIVDLFAKADVRMKSTSVDPWQVVETLLLSI